MIDSSLQRWILRALLLLGAGVFIPGIRWGLPSPAADQFLFPDNMLAAHWPGNAIEQAAQPQGPGDADSDRGSDVASGPALDRSRPTRLNQTDAQRARIIRRYRLFSYQPDEMITFMALARMKPGLGRLDPRLYQYGGLWIYPVGALLKIASWRGLVRLSGDPAFYLDHPDAFGRFYAVARAYTVIWALIGILAVWLITRKITGGLLLPATAALCYICMPVVINSAHEAKPHLPAAVLMLLAAWAAGNYVTTGKNRWAFWASAACGAAAGMVLWAAVALVIIPAMALLGQKRWSQRWKLLFAGLFVAAAVYFLANPYVAVHLLRNPAALRSNLGNSQSMYQAGPMAAALSNATALIAAGAGAPLMILGIAGFIAMLIQRFRRSTPEEEAYLIWLLAAPAGLVAIVFILLAAGKPGEYARFFLFLDLGLMICAVVAAGRWAKSLAARQIVCLLLVLSAAVYGFSYVRGFIADSSPSPSRLQAAVQLRQRVDRLTLPGELAGGISKPVLIVRAEPAPYCLPPVDLWRWDLVLWPKEGSPPPAPCVEVSLEPETNIWLPFRTPISWADRRFDIVDREVNR